MVTKAGKLQRRKAINKHGGGTCFSPCTIFLKIRNNVSAISQKYYASKTGKSISLLVIFAKNTVLVSKTNT